MFVCMALYANSDNVNLMAGPVAVMVMPVCGECFTADVTNHRVRGWKATGLYFTIYHVASRVSFRVPGVVIGYVLNVLFFSS